MSLRISPGLVRSPSTKRSGSELSAAATASTRPRLRESREANRESASRHCSAVGSCGMTSTRAVGSIRRATSLTNVVFPAPLGPVRAM